MIMILITQGVQQRELPYTFMKIIITLVVRHNTSDSIANQTYSG